MSFLQKRESRKSDVRLPLGPRFCGDDIDYSISVEPALKPLLSPKRELTVSSFQVRHARRL